MTQSQDEERFLEDVRRVLDEGQLPPGVAGRLATARRAAVAAADEGAVRLPSTWLPVGALASTVLAVAIAVVAADGRTLPALGDDRALAAAQEVELLEDLEFLAWLGDDARAG